MNKKKLTLSWRRPISYRNQSIDLLRKSCYDETKIYKVEQERTNRYKSNTRNIKSKASEIDNKNLQWKFDIHVIMNERSAK